MKKIVKVIIAVVLWLFSLGAITEGVTQGGTGMIVMGIISALLGLKVSGILPKDKGKTDRIKLDKVKEKEKLEEIGYLGSVSLMLESGLSISENSLCKLTYYKDKLTIEGSGVTYNLPAIKLLDVDIKSSVEIETFYNSSVGGAVGGAVMLGALGAVMGGRRKKKEIKKTEYFLVITYDKDGEVNFIVFDTSNSPLKARKFITLFKKAETKHDKVIDL